MTSSLRISKMSGLSAIIKKYPSDSPKQQRLIPDGVFALINGRAANPL